MRSALLAAADNPTLQRFVTTHGRRFGAHRFVAGETLDDFMSVVKSVNARGFRVAAGLLGEDVRSAEDARAAAQSYRTILDRFARPRASENIALKLPPLALAVNRDLALENVESLAVAAAKYGNSLRIDM